MDFLFRLFGMYPWRCTQCGCCFHRLQR
jgi:hypothetical protein